MYFKRLGQINSPFLLSEKRAQIKASFRLQKDMLIRAKNNKLIQILKKSDNPKSHLWAAKIEGCGLLKCKITYTDGTTKVVTNSCHEPGCFRCKTIRQANLTKQFTRKAQGLLKAHPNYIFRHLTISHKAVSVENMADVRVLFSEGLSRLNKYFKLKMPWFKGMVSHIEDKETKSGLILPHFHIIIAADPNFSQHEAAINPNWWTFMAQAAFGTKSISTKIQKINGNSTKQLKEQLIRTYKYGCKPGEFPVSDPYLAEVYAEAIYHRHAAGAFGEFRSEYDDFEEDTPVLKQIKEISPFYLDYEQLEFFEQSECYVS